MDSRASNSAPADICRQVNEVRCNLVNDVEELVESARTLADWRYYVRAYPWVCLAGAAAAGFLAVPSRLEVLRPSADALEELVRRKQLTVTSNGPAHAGTGIGGVVVGMLVNAALRGATSYLGQSAARFFAENGRPRGNDDVEPNC